jgi:hypothetical protein
MVLRCAITSETAACTSFRATVILDDEMVRAGATYDICSTVTHEQAWVMG